MADRRRQTFTAEEVARIMMEIPDDSEDSEFEGGEGDSNSDAGQQQSDFGDSDDNNIEEGVSYSDADQIESECGDSDNNNTNTETESNHVNISEHDNNVSNNGRPCRRQLAARKRPIPSVRSRSPSVRNRSNENGINVSWGELDKTVNANFPEYKGKHGPSNLLPLDSEPFQFFEMIFPDHLWDILVEQTNLYVRQKNRKTWHGNTTVQEMKAFIGALFFMALHRLPNFDHYFMSDWVFAVPAIQKVFTRNRFWELWQNFHLADNARQPAPNDAAYDKLYKLRPLIDGMRDTFRQSYDIGQYVSVDEHMVKGKGRNPFKQYLPNKPIKRGTKIWEVACSCCGYVFDFQVYTGKVNGVSEHGLAHRVVVDLVSQFRNQGIIVCMDNFFTGFPLMKELSEQSIYVVGTLRTNRKGYPEALKDARLIKGMKRGDYHSVASGDIVCSLWKDTKYVTFASNVHSSKGNTKIKRKLNKGETVDLPCPPSAISYNANMGAVDRHDQMVRSYAIDRKSRRWWVRLFVSFLDAIVVNAYIIYKENFKIMNMPQPQKPPHPMGHDKFMASIIHDLMGGFTCRRRPGPSPSLPISPAHHNEHDSVNMVELGLLKFGRCHHCCIGVRNAKRKETGFGCKTCMKRLCRSSCHMDYHRKYNIY